MESTKFNKKGELEAYQCKTCGRVMLKKPRCWYCLDNSKLTKVRKIILIKK